MDDHNGMNHHHHDEYRKSNTRRPQLVENINEQRIDEFKDIMKSKYSYNTETDKHYEMLVNANKIRSQPLLSKNPDDDNLVNLSMSSDGLVNSHHSDDHIHHSDKSDDNRQRSDKSDNHKHHSDKSDDYKHYSDKSDDILNVDDSIIDDKIQLDDIMSPVNIERIAEKPSFKQSVYNYPGNIPKQNNQQYSPPNFDIPNQHQEQYNQQEQYKQQEQYRQEQQGRQSQEQPTDRSKYPAGFYLEPLDEYKTYPPVVQKLKRMEIFTQLMDLEKTQGIKLSQHFTIDSDYEDMYLEYETHKFIRSKQVGVVFMKSTLTQMISGLEFLNQRFDPFSFKLKGWSDSFKIGMEEEETNYNEVFGELYDKYRGKGSKVEPELKLLFLIGMSGASYHASQTMAKLPGLDEVLEKNPELMRKLLSGINKKVLGPTQDEKEQQMLRDQQLQYQQMLTMKQQLEQQQLAQQLEQQKIAQQMEQLKIAQQQKLMPQTTKQEPKNEREKIIQMQEIERQNELNNLKTTSKPPISSKLNYELLERVKTDLNKIKERTETEKHTEKRSSDKIVASDSYDSTITETMSLSSSKAIRGRKKKTIK